MSQAKEKLQKDLNILQAMVTEMNDYLMSDILFYSMGRLNMPQLTLGGFLMRRRRLLALRNLLDDSDQQRLDEVSDQFDNALREKVVRLEQKAHREVEARLRQWTEHLKDMREGRLIANYATAAEIRTMLEEFLDKLQEPPYQLDPEISHRLAMLDQQLRGRWQKGGFVWPDGWQPAYPEEKYWWLYGKPK